MSYSTEGDVAPKRQISKKTKKRRNKEKALRGFTIGKIGGKKK